MRAVDADSRQPGTPWVRNLDWLMPADAAPRVPVTLRQLCAEEIGTLASVMGSADPAMIQQRLAAGKQCYVALVGNALAAYGRVSWHAEEIDEIGLRLHLMRERLTSGIAPQHWRCGAKSRRCRRPNTRLDFPGLTPYRT